MRRVRWDRLSYPEETSQRIERFLRDHPFVPTDASTWAHRSQAGKWEITKTPHRIMAYFWPLVDMPVELSSLRWNGHEDDAWARVLIAVERHHRAHEQPASTLQTP